MIANHGGGSAERPPVSPLEPWSVPGDPAVDVADAGRPSLGSRIATLVLGLVVGVVYGAVGTVAHPVTVTIGSAVLPFGLVVALVGVLALFVGFRIVLGGRIAAVGVAVGVVGIVSLFSLESVGGSILIREGVAGTVWLLGPALLGALVVSWPSLPPREHRLEAPDAKESPSP